jgi:hypothetical protein
MFLFKIYQIKNSAKQTCSQLLDSFAIKGGIFLKKMFNSLCLIVENLRIEICGFANNKICGFAICG